MLKTSQLSILFSQSKNIWEKTKTRNGKGPVDRGINYHGGITMLVKCHDWMLYAAGEIIYFLKPYKLARERCYCGLAYFLLVL